jgi:para-aminobenzoate synthetase component 1
MKNWVSKMNDLGSQRIPFLFIIDFEKKQPIVLEYNEIPSDVLFKLGTIKNYTLTGNISKILYFKSFPISLEKYKYQFDKVVSQIRLGNSFLINLTLPTPIESNYNLREIFNAAHAKYKLFYKNQFVVSSPECFVKIKNNKIYTYPMKGTIDANIPNAKEIILNDQKEIAEHYTIVDLLRNDLSMVSMDVKVNKFRYVDTIKTNEKKLLQVSSEIEGLLPKNYLEHLGDIFDTLLPAGSISGAPKRKTIEIIKDVETDRRNYYTGVFGYFDGQNIDSAVMIRFIELNEKYNLIYRSGCGITSMSDCNLEYHELCNKIYIPRG